MPPTANPADPKTLQDLIAGLGNVDGTIDLLKSRGNFDANVEAAINGLRDGLESEAADLFDVPAGEHAMVIEDDTSGSLYLAAVKGGKKVIEPVVPTLASEVMLKSDTSGGSGTTTTPPPVDTGTTTTPPVDTGTTPPPVDTGTTTDTGTTPPAPGDTGAGTNPPPLG